MIFKKYIYFFLQLHIFLGGHWEIFRGILGIKIILQIEGFFIVQQKFGISNLILIYEYL